MPPSAAVRELPARASAPVLSAVPAAPLPAPTGQVRLEQIGIRFGTGATAVEAVRGVDLSLAAGEFVSIVGPSGCGKSTLLNVVAGFTRPSEGRASLDGQAITGPGPDRGVVFQQYSLFPWLTVRGNVEYGLRVRGLPRAERAAVAGDLLARCGLSAFASHYPEQLSGGMRQRVGIVRALANEPRVLLLDEPFGALDAQTREVMQALLLDIWQRFRTTVLFITHDIEEAVFLSDRVCAMSARPGHILADLPVALPRPRDHDMTRTGEGARLVGELRSLIRAQSLAAFDPALA